MKANVSGLDGKEYLDEPLPAGTYSGEIQKAQERTNSNGKPYLNLSVKVTDGPDFPSGRTTEGEFAFGKWYYPNAQTDSERGRRFKGQRLKKVLDGAGVPIDDEGSFDIEDFKGADIRFTIKHDRMEGSNRLNVEIGDVLTDEDEGVTGSAGASASGLSASGL